MAAMTNLQKHPKSGVYRFRRAVPQELRLILGKSEIVETLRTKDVNEAKQKAKEVGLRIDGLFQAARDRRIGISQAEADTLIAAWKNDELKKDEETRFSAPTLDLTVPQATASINEFTELCLKHESLKTAQDRLDFRIIEAPLFDLLTKAGRFIDRQSAGYQIVAGMMLKAAREVVEEQMRRDQGDWTPSPSISLPTSTVSTRQYVVGSTPKPISAILEEWVAERKPPAKTESDWRTAIRRFIEVVGQDIDVQAVGKSHCREFKHALLKMPRSVSGQMRTMSMPEIISKTEGDDSITILSVGTVNKSLAALGSVLELAVVNGYIDSNPASRMKIKEDNRRPKRLSYEYSDLSLIFSSPAYTGCKSEKFRWSPGSIIIRDGFYWLPLMALYMGARMEEIGQAHLTDFHNDQGRHFLRIATIEDDQSVKSKSSNRFVPIHPTLVACGLLEYAENLRQENERQLFPELKADNRGSYTSRLSKRWGRYARRLGIAERRKVFHSFRHNFVDACRRGGLDEAEQDALLGHSGKTMGRRYGSDYPNQRLAEAIRKIAYPGLDLSHLEISQSVNKTNK